MNMPLAWLPDLIERMRQTQPVRSEQELKDWHWRHEILPHLRASQLPPRFWFVATKWKREQKKAFDATRSLLLRKGATIALVGERGMGKTTIAAQLIIERAMNDTLLPWHRRPPYRKLSRLIALYKSIYADFGSIETESLLSRHDSLCTDHSLLVIDELHDCEDQRIKNRLLTDTIDKRYANLMDTILISNQTPEQFMETTSDSVLSRIKEHGRIIHCTWESWR